MLTAWSSGTLATIQVPDAWSIVEARLPDSMEALPLLSRARRLGPVLAYPERELAWWLVPPTAAEHLGDHAPRIVVHDAGWQMKCPALGDYLHGCGWLEKPDGSGTLTDPVMLGAALSHAQAPRSSRGSAR
ncbi:hypothetical protein [Streptomyces sulphureus]|uniref:hypothetical protein n=1 Tax=Streptomyces sulphureus TaxID=47758 RepID=UPI00035E4208|nr:hypothetical protein [Streptomyces sulphureus]